MKQFALALITQVSNAWCFLFGKITWKMPPWLKSIVTEAKDHPRTFYTKSCFVLILLLTIMASAYWYHSLPKPVQLTAMIATPKLTPNDKQLIPDVLRIDFGLPAGGTFYPKSVAPLNHIGKDIIKGISMTPAMPGSWRWQSDSQLVFTPSKDWPAGQSYQIQFEQNLFTSGTHLDSLTASFTTLPFSLAITDYRFYQDPIYPQVRQAVATIQFSHPVNGSSLDSHIVFQWQRLSKTKDDFLPFHYVITFDNNKRTAYLHSDTLPLPSHERYLELTIAKGVAALASAASTREPSIANLLIPDAGSYFKVKLATASVIRNEKDMPEQVLSLETTLGVKSEELAQVLHAYLLPKDYPATAHGEAKINYQWQDPGEVTPAILALAKPINLQAIPAERDYATLHSYIFQQDTPSYIYLKLDKGIKSFGDFVLANDYVALLPTPVLPREISFLHPGSLLALGTEEKLSVSVRGLAAVKFDIARVLPENINHLITQTSGDFSNPSFINANFTQQNISEIASKIQLFDQRDLGKAQYTALDLSQYLSQQLKNTRPLGLFLLRAQGWDVDKKIPLEGLANRLVLITDLGLVVKDNKDGSHDMFVQSVTKGMPVQRAEVSVLGKNGLAVITGLTDAQGHVHFPPLTDFNTEREPTVYLVQHDQDVSFIPFFRFDRQLNYSRFDIGGALNETSQTGLTAYLFTDRGIFRPGDMVHIGMIVKQPYVMPQPAGVPLEVMIVDPRGVTVKDEKITLNDSGYLSLDFQTNATSATGQYIIQLYLVKDKHVSNVIGSTIIHVNEFLPDRLRIAAHLSEENLKGWLSPSQLSAKVNLWNLYGAPAALHRISGKLLLTPQIVKFKEFSDFIFFDPLLNPKTPPKILTETLVDTQTNDQGQAEFDLKLDRFEKATYQLTVFAEGFEAEGGRSVSTQVSALVSPLTALVGYKPDGDLQYIKQHANRQVNVISINSQLKQQALSQLQLHLFKQQPINTLIKKEDGTYQYQSVMQNKLIHEEPFAISLQGSHYVLDTHLLGNFLVTITDNMSTVLSQFNYTVVGNDSQALPKNAELNVKLNKSTFMPGEDIEMQITSPYSGAGLMTIEREKVYAYRWFQTNTTASIQHIHIPDDFQGDGYVNIVFVRDINSPEIFMSPLSIHVTPFSVTHQQHDIKVQLTMPSLTQPGQLFPIIYQTDKPSKIIVFAVDEGILQVSKYVSPDPLAFFFQEHALEVFTQQIVDQILPKFIMERELSQVGGDGGESMLQKNLNPFKRKTDLPVVYWSGILDADANAKQVTYQIPAYFNGSLRVMAVAVAANAVGSASQPVEVRGHFVLNPNVPTFVAPGDQFAVTASIANNVKGSGENAAIMIQLSTSSELEVLGSTQQLITIPEGGEGRVRYMLRAKSVLGSADVTLQAKLGDKINKLSSTLSIRPSVPYTTFITSGYTTDTNKSLRLDREFYPAYRTVEAAVSSNPLILVSGLQRFLNDYPYGCTEQLISKGFPFLVMTKLNLSAKDAVSVTDKIAKTIEMIMQRQMSSGGFNYWPDMGTAYSNEFASVYAMHFLTEAKMEGYSVPNDTFSLGLEYLKGLAKREVTNLEDARIQAYAIYLITRNEIVSTAYLTRLQGWLAQQPTLDWQHDIISVYIAATYQLLKSTAEATRLISYYQPNMKKANGVTDFYNQTLGDAQYLYLVAKHFPDYLLKVDMKLVTSLVDQLNSDSISTLLSAYTALALSAYQDLSQIGQNDSFSIQTLLANGQQLTVSTSNGMYQRAAIEPGVKEVIFHHLAKQTYFFQLTQAGFVRELPTETIKQGIEVVRELRNVDNNEVVNASLGEELIVHLRARAIDDQYHDHIALIDLLPGGFEVVRDSVKMAGVDYVDIREDRVVFFVSLSPDSKEITYRIKATTAGKFIVPPSYGTSMYYPLIKSMGIASEIRVSS